MTQLTKWLVLKDILSYCAVLAKHIHGHNGGLKDMLPSCKN